MSAVPRFVEWCMVSGVYGVLCSRSHSSLPVVLGFRSPLRDWIWISSERRRGGFGWSMMAKKKGGTFSPPQFFIHCIEIEKWPLPVRTYVNFKLMIMYSTNICILTDSGSPLLASMILPSSSSSAFLFCHDPRPAAGGMRIEQARNNSKHDKQKEYNL